MSQKTAILAFASEQWHNVFSTREDVMKIVAGQRFGRLTAIERVTGGKWLCQCDCGGTATCLTNNLTRGNSTSCGCKGQESKYRHGMSRTPMYRAWLQMFQRCENPNDAAYHNYGGRGITVDPSWRDFTKFVADMGIRPAGFELDRRDNNGNYCKENCRWITRKANLNNRRDNLRITHEGETLTVHQWSERTGVPPRTIAYRYSEGWPTAEVLSPVKRYSNKKRHDRKEGN